MIKSTKTISMAEAQEFINDDNLEAKAFIKNFTKLSSEQAKELREKLLSLNLIKLNEKYISNIIDLLPADKEDLGKVLNNTSLDENEINKVLETIKEYK